MDIEKSLENAHEKIIEVQQENDKLRSDLQTEVQERVALEKRYKQLSDEVLNLKRYSRQFNVRINGIENLFKKIIFWVICKRRK